MSDEEIAAAQRDSDKLECPVMFYCALEDEQHSRLRALAWKKGLNKAVLVREALDMYLELEETTVDTRAEDGPACATMRAWSDAGVLKSS